MDSEPPFAMATLARSFHPVSYRETCTVTPLAVSDSTSVPLLRNWSHPGVPSCQRATPWASAAASGVTVQVSLYDTGWKLRANVAIANSSTESIHIEPSKFILDEIGANGRPLFYQDPEQLAKNVTHQVLWTETTAGPTEIS